MSPSAKLVRFLVHLGCFAVCIAGTVLVATCHNSQPQIFVSSCGCVIALLCIALTADKLHGLVVTLAALAFFSFPVGLVATHSAYERTIANNNSNSNDNSNTAADEMVKLVVGLSLSLSSSVVALMFAAAVPTRAAVTTHVSSIVAMAGFVVTLVGCCIVWAHSITNVLSMQGLVAGCLAAYCAILPHTILTIIAMFLATYVACLGLYAGLEARLVADKDVSYSNGVLCIGSGLCVVLVALLWALQANYVLTEHEPMRNSPRQRTFLEA